MSVDESRHDEPVGKIDDLCAFSLNLLYTAYICDPVSFNGDGHVAADLFIFVSSEI